MQEETRGKVEIGLTEEQREQIREATGEDVDRINVNVREDAADNGKGQRGLRDVEVRL
jgi:hypothetical protein